MPHAVVRVVVSRRPAPLDLPDERTVAALLAAAGDRQGDKRGRRPGSNLLSPARCAAFENGRLGCGARHVDGFEARAKDAAIPGDARDRNTRHVEPSGSEVRIEVTDAGTTGAILGPVHGVDAQPSRVAVVPSGLEHAFRGVVALAEIRCTVLKYYATS